MPKEGHLKKELESVNPAIQQYESVSENENIHDREQGRVEGLNVYELSYKETEAPPTNLENHDM